MSEYVGVDWASKGWLAVAVDDGGWSAEMHPAMHSIWFSHRDADSILVDIPIGLPEDECRACDELARDRLGVPRKRSVFWTPCREAVRAGSYEAAREANVDCRGDSLSSQAWGLIPRIQEVDRLLRDVEPAGELILESHPEVCFDALGLTSQSSKHDTIGLDARQACLEGFDVGPDGTFDQLVDTRIEDVSPWARRIGSSNKDDILDAMALAVSAKLADGEFDRLPEAESIPRDGKELPMQIVYYEA